MSELWHVQRHRHPAPGQEGQGEARIALALLFPGQASQVVGMGVDLRRASPRADELFELADRLTGLPIGRLCAEGPIERLTETDVAQPAVVATSLAALAVLNEHLELQPIAVAGHSVGELAACVAAEALDAESALGLVHARAQAMANACGCVDGTMMAVLGLEAEPLIELCAQVSADDGSVEIANLNAPGQLVVSGERTAVERLAQQARAAGARRVLPLSVGGPFHSVYMESASELLRPTLERMPFRTTRVPLVANSTATLIREPEELRDELAAQVAAPVRWVESLHTLAGLGCDRFLEVGPGSVLAGLVKRTLPTAQVASFGALADVDKARTLLAQD